MRVLFTICGRAGSKGIKNKNIRDFLGISLPLYTLSAIELYLRQNQKIAADVAVNTDSIELVEILTESKLFPVEFVKRKENLGGDLVPKVQVIQDTYVELKNRKKTEYDMIVDLDITSPLRTVTDIENLIKKKQEIDCDVVFSVTESRRNPYFNMVKKTQQGYKKVIDSNFTARQQAPEIFDMNASMYAYKPEFLMSGKGVLEGYSEVIHMYDTGILDLDYENDFALMEVIADYLFKSRREFGEIVENILHRQH